MFPLVFPRVVFFMYPLGPFTFHKTPLPPTRLDISINLVPLALGEENNLLHHRFHGEIVSISSQLILSTY